MDDQEALAAVNRDTSLEKLQSLVRQGNTTSFIFSIKNRIGGLARALKVFQENGINVVHIESRRSRRANSEYEIYVDLEGDRALANESMRQLQRQVSCVHFDLTHLNELSAHLEQINDGVFADDGTPNGNGALDLPPPSPFLDKNGQPIKRKSKFALDVDETARE